MRNNVFFEYLGGVMILYGFWLLRLIAGVKKWVAIGAKLTKAELVQRDVNIRGSRGQYFAPLVEFEYSVDGKIYRGNKFSLFNFTIGMKEELYDVIGAAKVGDSITIYYNPKSVGRAIMRIPEYSGVAAFIVFLGGVILILAILI